MPMIVAQGLSRSFGEVVAVRNLNLGVSAGEVFGFLGPNGAGKTTTVRMLTGLIAPTAGSAFVNGHDVVADPQQVRGSVGLLTETPGLYHRLTALDNLRLFARLHGLRDFETRMRRYLQMLELWDRRDEPVGAFSKGMKQKLALARALLHEPPVLFLDEPTSGLDPSAARVVRDFIVELRGRGRTIFLCTHNLDEADRLCDRIAIIRTRLLRVDTPTALRRALYGRAVRIRLRDPEESFAQMARALPWVEEASLDGSTLRVVVAEPETHNPELVGALVQAGAAIQYVEEEEQSLEKVYLDLLKKSEAEA